MDPIKVLDTVAKLIDLVKQAGAAAPDVMRAIKSINNLTAKDPVAVTQEELDAVIAENVAADARIQGKQIDPEED